MKNIVLTGMMGSGKTSCGKKLALITGRRFVDTDEWIVSQEGKSINSIFSENGEDYFRTLERKVTEETSLLSDCVIATGGGMILNERCRENLKRTGVIVFLRRDSKELLKTLDAEARPLASGGEEAFLALYRGRLPVYQSTADLIIETAGSVDETVALIMEKLKQMGLLA